MEQYIVSQSKRFKSDPYAAKAWILTAKTLYPNSFNVQFENYLIERNASNHKEAAKCFGFLATNFHQNPPAPLWEEIGEITKSMRVPEEQLTDVQENYMKMFHHLQYDVQHKLLLLTVKHTDNPYEQCKLLILLLKRFPQTIVTHSPGLLDMIVQGINLDPLKYEEMLVNEAIPLIYHKTPELPPHLVCTLFTVSLQYYVKKLVEEESNDAVQEMWRKIFEILGLCGKILKWESLLPYNKTWSKQVYCQKLIQIVTATDGRTTGEQKFFYSITLFIFSLQEYIQSIHKTKANETEYVLVHGFNESDILGIGRVDSIEPPVISTSSPSTQNVSIAFVTATTCWQILNGELFGLQFNQLLISLPLNSWITVFVFDLAVYFCHHNEAVKMLEEIKKGSSLQKEIRILSLILSQGPLTVSGFECILKILMDLPTEVGTLYENMNMQIKTRHLMLLPLTKKSVVQYCVKAIINCLVLKFLTDPQVSDNVLGNILVLCQLEHPAETAIAEQVFQQIRAKRFFSYLLVPSYIITIDYVEEFAHIWHAYNCEYNFDFLSAQPNLSVGGSSRRIGTRGADKGAREDFKQVVKQQILHANDDILALIVKFITHEKQIIYQSIA